jgi:hypothetical protein
MTRRIHLDSVEGPKGTHWFTLIIRSKGHYFVERYDDSCLSSLKERLKHIQPEDFVNHKVNGVSLAKLVDEKFREIKLPGAPDKLTGNLPPPPSDKSDTFDDP